MDDAKAPEKSVRAAATRTAVAFAVAAAFGLGAYVLLEAVRPNGGLVRFSFLLILPAAVSAFVAFVADPWGSKSLRSYLMVPVWLGIIVVIASVFILHEGVICILLLAPLWLASGLAGAAITYLVRDRIERRKTYCSALLLAPLLAMQCEPLVPLPSTTAEVTRTIVIDAPADRIWPLLRGVPDVRSGEGRWNLTQDVLGVPRPLGARLVAEGVGADRLATWTHQIRFRERITDWRPGERIGWSFIFDDLKGWGYADRHLLPDSPYFRVTSGGYTLAPLGSGRTRITLSTRYWMRTPVNGYAALWGQVFLGDLENNLLALVKGRAEAARPADA